MERFKAYAKFGWIIAILGLAVVIFLFIWTSRSLDEPAYSDPAQKSEIDQELPEGMVELNFLVHPDHLWLQIALEEGVEADPAWQAVVFIGALHEGELLWIGELSELPQEIMLDPSLRSLRNVQACAFVVKALEDSLAISQLAVEKWQDISGKSCARQEITD